MIDAVYEILSRANCEVDDGERDAGNALWNAFEIEITRDWVLWDLMKEVFNPRDLLKGELDEDPYITMHDYVCSEILGDIEDYIEEHTWTIHYCDGPSESDEFYYAEYGKESEFDYEVESFIDDGWRIISKYDNEVFLQEVEEDE